MKLLKEGAELFLTSGLVLSKTSHLCIGAHQDDIELMAAAPILECYCNDKRWFTGVTVTDGAGSPRSGVYERFTDEDMKKVRINEQKLASMVGKYLAQFLLSYSSSEVKYPENQALINELSEIIITCSPEVIYTHNLADKHDTHVAVALRTISAIRKIPKSKRPSKLIGLEVWRGLDWVCDNEKLALPINGYDNLSSSLVGIYDSQISGGKRYDLAAVGRRLANATFFASHNVDDASGISYGIDLTELILDDSIDPSEYIVRYINNFKTDVTTRIKALL